MVSPARAEIVALVQEATDMENPTLREAAEWFKEAVKPRHDEPLSNLESERLDSAWKILVRKIAEREGVPTGPLSTYIAVVADQDLSLMNTAAKEVTEALVGE